MREGKGCLARAFRSPSRIVDTSSHTTNLPWHQQPDIIRAVLGFLDTTDILRAELSCSAWRDARATLTTEVAFTQQNNKLYKARQAWLKANFDRISRAQWSDSSSSSTTSTPNANNFNNNNIKFKSVRRFLTYQINFRQWKEQAHAKQAVEVVGLLCQARQASSLAFSSSLSLTALPGQLCSLKQLQQLTISSMPSLTAIPEDFGGLVSLKQLSVIDCSSLCSLPSSTAYLPCLEQLSIIGCRSLENLPAQLPSSLKSLTCCSCSAIQTFPRFGQLQQLQQLEIAECRGLRELPDDLCELQQLEILILSLRLQFLPPYLGRLTKLTELFIAHVSDSVVRLPESICSLGSLMRLTLLGWPGLQQLPQLGGLSQLQHLAILHCDNLQSLPESLGDLQSLKRLDVSDCELLCELPESLGQLSELTCLALSSCEHLRYLPITIGELSSLRELTLCSCGLRRLPESLGDLADGALQSVTISGCYALQVMPVSMGPLKNKITPGALAAAAAEKAVAAWRDGESARAVWCW